MPEIGDKKLKNNLGCLSKVAGITRQIIESSKKKDNNTRMFSEGTINKYTQQTEDREDMESEEEMEIG